LACGKAASGVALPVDKTLQAMLACCDNTGATAKAAQKKGGEVALPARISTTTLIWNCLALQQRHDVLRQRVGLRQHRGAGLLQDLGLGQVGGFCREVGVLDA
jgi:hypothetical protein